MSDVNDGDLLIRFRQSESDEAFAAIVHRHIHLVYSVALRHTTNRHEAEEISQAVFIILARKAPSLGRETVLSGWLCHTARLVAANFLRSEQRRSFREQEAFMRSTLTETIHQDPWHDLAPLLDEAMGHLRSNDRDALVLRHFENRTLSEVGKVLGVGERAAQKRVDRAVEKLRRFFNQRGVTTAATLIAAQLSAHSIQAAPLGLAAKISTTAAKGSAVAGSTLTLVKGTIKTMAWLKTKIALIVGTTALLAVGTGVASTHLDQLHAHLNQLHAHLYRLHGNGNDAQALQNKQEAEHSGGPVNVAKDPNAQKHLDEQKALREPQNPAR